MIQVYDVLDHRVIDGDTVEVTLQLPFRIQVKYGCRIEGIDCPERHTDEGALLTYFLAEYLAEKELKARYIRDGKYSNRFVGDILFDDGKRLSHFLLTNNLAIPWPPKTPKPTWDDECLTKFNEGIQLLL